MIPDEEFFLENGFAKVHSVLSKKTLELCIESYDAVFASKDTDQHRHDLGGHVESKGTISTRTITDLWMD